MPGNKCEFEMKFALNLTYLAYCPSASFMGVSKDDTPRRYLPIAHVGLGSFPLLDRPKTATSSRDL